jgi:hypothetical protein
LRRNLHATSLSDNAEWRKYRQERRTPATSFGKCIALAEHIIIFGSAYLEPPGTSRAEIKEVLPLVLKLMLIFTGSSENRGAQWI